MIAILAFRQLWVKKVRSLFLLLGYGLGVGVMIVLLAVGEAMLDQSRDVSLVGGGEVTVLPQGIDVEAMRTGGASGMFFSIDRARFITRQLLGGPRHQAMVRAVSPAIEGKLVYLRHGTQLLAARAGGEIPTRAAEVGAGLHLLRGSWRDSPTDSSYSVPTSDQLYNQLDHFHFSPVTDSSWGEWHYFNVVIGPHEWWYVSYVVGGEVPYGRWGGRILITHRRTDGRYDRFSAQYPSGMISIDTARADVTMGQNFVHQRDGLYKLVAQARGPSGDVNLNLSVVPSPNRYFPPVELREGALPSGYVVPALSAEASGKVCLADRCTTLTKVPAYHDHNWGVWRDVTWDWGSARGAQFNVLYGAVYSAIDTVTAVANGSPRIFVALVDSLGVRQILRAREVKYSGAPPGTPTGFEFTAARDQDTIRVIAQIDDALATSMQTGALGRHFLQMRGRFSLEGRLAGRSIRDSGTGFFESYVE